MIPDLMMLVLYISVVVYISGLFAMTIKKRDQIAATYTLPAMLTSIILWALAKVMFYLLPLEEPAVLMQLLTHPLRIAAVVFLLLYVIHFYDLQNYKKPAIAICLLVMPTFVLGWALLTPTQELLLTNIEVVVEPPHLFAGEETILIWFCRIFLLLLLAIMIHCTTSHHVQIPLIYRAPSHQLYLGVVWMVCGFALSWIQFKYFSVDFFLLLCVPGMTYVYNSTKSTQGMLFLRRARNEVFNHLSERILILDEDSCVVKSNKNGDKWLVELGLDPAGRINYHNIIDALNQRATNSQKLEEEDSGVDYYFDDNGKTKTLNLREKVIYDNKKHQIGLFVICSDVSENRALLQRLEVSAGRDALTGLNNRNMMNYYKKEIDNSDSLPLAIIVCDLNNLKTVNDGHGHQHGDLMLRIAGEALSVCCPPTSMVGRVGGDEFLILMPNTKQEQADELIAYITEHLKEASKASPFEVTIAMGAAVRESMDKTFDEVFDIADEVMYQNKRKIKGTRAAQDPPR